MITTMSYKGIVILKINGWILKIKNSCNLVIHTKSLQKLLNINLNTECKILGTRLEKFFENEFFNELKLLNQHKRNLLQVDRPISSI